MRIKVSENLVKFAKLVQKKAELYIVGGFVRNAFLGIAQNDIDLASALSVADLDKLCQGTCFEVKEYSKILGTAKIKCSNEVWEYTTFRKEVYGDGGEHTPVKVKFITDLKEDAKRRDFTINAIYYNILKEEVIDIYSGLLDLKKRRLRCIESPGYVFDNDGLRILRMVRIACELNFSIHHETFLTARKMCYRLKDISGTRKYEELMLILNSYDRYHVNSKSFMRGLKLLNILGVWSNVFNTNKIKYNLVKKVDKEQRFEGLLIDLVNYVKPDCVAYYLNFVLKKEGLMLSNAKVKCLVDVVCGYFDALNKMKNKDYFFRYYSQFPEIGKIINKKNKLIFLKYNFFYKYINKYKVPIQIRDLKINGNDLKDNFPKLPNKKYSVVLLDLLDKVFEGKIKNEKFSLIDEVKNEWHSYN